MNGQGGSEADVGLSSVRRWCVIADLIISTYYGLESLLLNNNC